MNRKEAGDGQDYIRDRYIGRQHLRGGGVAVVVHYTNLQLRSPGFSSLPLQLNDILKVLNVVNIFHTFCS